MTKWNNHYIWWIYMNLRLNLSGECFFLHESIEQVWIFSNIWIIRIFNCCNRNWNCMFWKWDRWTLIESDLTNWNSLLFRFRSLPTKSVRHRIFLSIMMLLFILVQVMMNLITNGGGDAGLMHCTGHSLGAHVCGHFGRWAAARGMKPDRCTGNDDADQSV